MKIHDIECTQGPGNGVLTAWVEPCVSAKPIEVFYKIEGIEYPLSGGTDALAVALLTPSMFERESLSIEGTLSQPLVRNLGRAQKILSQWYDYLETVPIAAESGGGGHPDPASGVLCCFSAGVDSWYSLLKHDTRITHLLLIRGFDIGLDNDALWQAALSRAGIVAERMGKRLVTCATNIRDIADKRRSRWGRPFNGDFWGESLHGAALASVALLLQNDIGEVIIPATHNRAQIKPWGSSPLLDHFWSNGRVRILHDGCEAGRTEKVRAIAQCDLALETLRVCYHDTPDINCGRCEKCLRTILALRTCGALDRAKTFPPNRPLAEMRGLIVPRHLRHHYEMLRDEARRTGDTELLETIEVIMGERLSMRRMISLAKRAARETRLGRQLHAARGRFHKSAIALPADRFGSRSGSA
jgi:hypothetical protein